MIPWTLIALVTVLCVYRPWHFELQPEDAPGTLHWLLWPIYNGFVHLIGSRDDAADYWVILCAVLLAIPVVLVLLVQYYATRGGIPQGRVAAFFCSRKLFVASIAVSLLVSRFPLLFQWATNPDEDDFLALAQKLLANPITYRSVDTQTSGPLVVYPLNLAALFGLSPDYAFGRIVLLLLVMLSLYLAMRTVRLMASEAMARACILPAVVFFAVLRFPDFVSYSSEMVPILLVSLAVFAATQVIYQPQSHRLQIFGLGALAMAGFFAKAQCVPILLAVSAVAVVSLYREGLNSFGGPLRGSFWRPLWLFPAGMAPPALIALAAILLANSWHDWWFSYILWNFRYTRAGGRLLGDLESLAGFVLNLTEFQLLGLSLLTVLVCSVYLLCRGRQRNRWLALIEILAVAGATVALAVRFAPVKPSDTDRWGLPAAYLLASGLAVAALTIRDFLRDQKSGWAGVLCLALLGSALFSVFASHNQFPHYLLFLVFPACVTIGWLMGRHREKSTRLALIVMFAVVAVGEGVVRIPLLRETFMDAPPATQGLEGPLIRKLTPARSSIVAWGWFASAYLASARTMATRDPHVQPLFCCNDDLIAQYRERFLRDLRSNPAALFLDALDVSCCYLNDRKVSGFETVPAIRSYVDEHYIWVAEEFRQRFYLRRDLAAMPGPRACDEGVLFCYQAVDVYAPEAAPLRMPEHARLEADFTPLDAGDAVTIFGTGPAPQPGFRFEHMGGGKYRLVAGGVGSREVALPEGLHVSLAIDFDGATVTLRCNGEVRDRLTLGRSLAGTDIQLTAAGWKGRRYAAALDRVEIRALPR